MQISASKIDRITCVGIEAAIMIKKCSNEELEGIKARHHRNHEDQLEGMSSEMR